VASRWFLVVRSGSCPECGLVASSVAEGDLGVAIVEEAGLWDAFLARLSDSPSLSTRPASDVWSALEYAGHVRDTLTLFADRIQLAIDIENPRFEYQDQEAAVVSRMYNDRDPREVAAAICANAERLARVLDTLPSDTWARGGTRLDDEYFDVALLARFTLHEVRHHRVDAEQSALANGESEERPSDVGRA
jgi:DinB superfamily